MSDFCAVCWTSIVLNEQLNNNFIETLEGGGGEETNASLYVESLKYRTVFQCFLSVFGIEDPRIWLKKPFRFCSICGHQLTRVSHLKEELKRLENLVKEEEKALKERLRMFSMNSKGGDGDEEGRNWWELMDSQLPTLAGEDRRDSEGTNGGGQRLAHDEEDKEGKEIEKKIPFVSTSPVVSTVETEEESFDNLATSLPSTSKTRIPFHIRKRRLLPEQRGIASGSQDEPDESEPKRAKRGGAREDGESSTSLNLPSLSSSPQNPISQRKTSPFKPKQVEFNHEATTPIDISSDQNQDDINFDNKNKDETLNLSKRKTVSITGNWREGDVPQWNGNGMEKLKQFGNEAEMDAVESLLKLLKGNGGDHQDETGLLKDLNIDGNSETLTNILEEDKFFPPHNVQIESKEIKGDTPKSSNNSTKKVAKKRLKIFNTELVINEPNKCPKCDKKFGTIHLLRIHLNAAHKLGPLHNCPICERPYYGKKAPRRHIWTHYSEEDKKEALGRGEKVPSCLNKSFMCDKCPSAYTTNSELLKHQKQVHEEVVLRHVCGECGTSVKNLAGHMRQSHPKEEDFRFVCTICEAKFINSARLKQHKLSKHGEGKKVQCERCEKLFKTVRELNVHVNSDHLKIKPYKCGYCNMAFSRKMSWTRHIHGIHDEKKVTVTKTKTRERDAIAFNKGIRRISVK